MRLITLPFIHPTVLHWLFFIAIGALSFMPHIAAAQSSLDVQFEATPLFLEANVMPGDGETRTLTVTNNGTEDEDVYVTVQEEFDAGLAPIMQLTVASGGTEYFSGSFTDFFAAGEIPLGTLVPNDDRTYSFTASLPASTGNAYQSKELGFDLMIGFADGESTTDNPETTSTGGGGGTGGGTLFDISNEEAATENTSATVTWTTNRPGTTYLVCGLIDNGPFRLESASPFGYEYRIDEVTDLVTQHSVTQTDLAPGDYECMPVSRPSERSNFTTGDPVQFTIAGPPPLVAGAATSAAPARPTAPPTGSVLGVGKGTLGGPTYDEWRAGLDAERGTTTDLNNDSLSSTTAIASSGERSEIAGENFLTKQITERPFFWGIIALLLGLGAILGTRRFARR